MTGFWHSSTVSEYHNALAAGDGEGDGEALGEGLGDGVGEADGLGSLLRLGEGDAVAEGDGEGEGLRLDDGDPLGLALGKGLDKGLLDGAGEVLGEGDGLGEAVGTSPPIAAPHSPGMLTIIPLDILMQYGSLETSSKIVMPAGFSCEPTVSRCAIISFVMIFTAIMVPSSSMLQLPRRLLMLATFSIIFPFKSKLPEKFALTFPDTESTDQISVLPAAISDTASSSFAYPRFIKT